jgi:hypothetical protein
VEKAFGLPKMPERIEVYDNSHIMGTNAVGAMIVAGPEGFVKKQYRKFNIKSTELTPGDDFAMMKEVLRRRFSRLAKERAAAGQVNALRQEGFSEAATPYLAASAQLGMETSRPASSPLPEGEGQGEGLWRLREASPPIPDGAAPLTPTLSPWERGRPVAPQEPSFDNEAQDAASHDESRPQDQALNRPREAALSEPAAAPDPCSLPPAEDEAAPALPPIPPADDESAIPPEDVEILEAAAEPDAAEAALGLEDDEADITSADDGKSTSWGCPDLVLIDGGAGQLSAAHEVLGELGLGDITLVGIAKGPDRNAGREHFHMRGRPAFMLEPRDPVLYFVQRLRDEAHRFAIGTHRAKRAKSIAANPVDEIPGIGAKRRRALLKYFGSAKAISRAGLEDLQTVEGISAAMAQKIYDHFRR